MDRNLQRHPESRGGAGLAVAAEAVRSRAGRLSLVYRVKGDLAEVVVPQLSLSDRMDGLWEHTCFEAFVAFGEDGYVEFNLAPSTEWAAYRFSGYRAGMILHPQPPPLIETETNPNGFEMRAVLNVSEHRSPEAAWRVGLSAVLEHKDGRRSYWALAHPPGKPDFHHPDSFVLELPPPDLSRVHPA